MAPGAGHDGEGVVSGSRARERAAVDAPVTVAAAAYLIGLNQLIVNLQPLLLGALADAYKLGDAQLGHISAIFIGFNTLAVLSAPMWVRRVDWRALTTIAMVCATAALAAGALVSTLSTILLLFALLGVVKGVLGAPAFACLGDTSNPDRSYAVSLIVQSVLAAAAATCVAQWLLPRHGVGGVFLGLAAIAATGLVAARRLPARGVAAAPDPPHGSKPDASLGSALAPAVGLLALGVFVCGILSFWYFAERIGAARGVPVGLIGAAVSLCALATVATAAIVAWLGGRLASLWFVATGVLVVIAGYACLAWDSDLAYVAALVLFAMGWGLAQPGYWTIIRKVDAGGRLFVAAPAAGGAAGVLTGLLAGPVIARGGYEGLILCSAALLAGSAACLLLADRLGARAARKRLAADARDRAAAVRA
jgi:MFS family permease